MAIVREGVTIAVEYDSWYWHAGREEYDARRDDEMMTAGWCKLRVKSDTQLPTAEQLETAIGRSLAGERHVELLLDDWFYWPGTDEKTRFGYTIMHNKKQTRVQGSLLLIRHMAPGEKYRVKSNALSGLSLGEAGDPIFGWASFGGKCTYKDKDWEEPEGDHEFLVYVEDHDEPGRGDDQFWIEVNDKDASVIAEMSTDRDAFANKKTLSGGSIVVPHTPN